MTALQIINLKEGNLITNSLWYYLVDTGSKRNAHWAKVPGSQAKSEHGIFLAEVEFYSYHLQVTWTQGSHKKPSTMKW